MISKRMWSSAAGAMAFGAVAFGAMGLASSGFAAAQQYRPSEFLTLDLSKAVLSPKPLAPAAGFTSGSADQTVDHGNPAAPARAELLVDPKPVPAAIVHPDSKPVASVGPTNHRAAPPVREAYARAERPAAHKPKTLVALHGRNPVEAQARDTGIERAPKIQTWPCRTGGICDWKR